MSCPCCVENYNKGTRSEVKCYFEDCNYSSCKECVRTYLTGTTNEPHCMKCRKKWDLEFTKASLNASFMSKEYRAHRQTILADRTISQIQEHYPAAILLSQRRKDNVEIAGINAEIEALHNQINEKHRKIVGIRQKTNQAESAAGGGERRKFIMPCQTGGCRGMLSTAYKCDLCEKFTCSKCLESIEGAKEDHECVPANVETAEEIRKNTRPCPNCGCRISKIDGCDQMWCIECKTAFSWSKGTVEVGVVHNPHYYQWMRQNGGMPRTDGMPPGAGCNENRLTTQIQFIREMFCMLARGSSLETDFLQNVEVSKYTMNELRTVLPLVYENYHHIKEAKYCEELESCKRAISMDFFSDFYRFIAHSERVTLAQLNYGIRMRNDDNHSILLYILGEETKEGLSEFLVKKDIANARDGAHRDILEALIMVGKQILMDLYNELSEIQVDFSWRLIGDQLNMFRNGRGGNYDSIEHTRDKMINFAKFYTVFYLNHKEGIENMYRQCAVISNKYMRAVNQYASYANAEMIKFLMLHNSKKQMYMWDIESKSARYYQFDMKADMVNGIAKHRDALQKLSEGV